MRGPPAHSPPSRSITRATASVSPVSCCEPSRCCPVLCTNTSSRVGWTRSSDSTSRPSWLSATTIGPTSEVPCSSSTIRVPSLAGSGRPKRPRTTSARGSFPACSTRQSSRWGLPTSALSAVGVPSATSRPPEMIPTRSASWSASSRYWVVRKTVVPVVVQLADLLPDRLAADRVEAGGGLIEKEDLRRVDEGRCQVEPAAHAAGVGAHAPVGGQGEAHPVEQPLPALLPVRSWRCRAGSPGARAARGRSSADPGRPPGAPRRSCDGRRRHPSRRRSRPRRLGRRSAEAEW